MPGAIRLIFGSSHPGMPRDLVCSGGAIQGVRGHIWHELLPPSEKKRAHRGSYPEQIVSIFVGAF